MRKTLLIVVAVAVVVVIVGVRFYKKDGGAAVPTYELARVEKQPMWVKVSATGLVEPVVKVDVKSKASGVVERLPIEMGDAVRRGQVIAELDTTEIKNQLDQGRAAWAVATQSVRVQEQALRRVEELAGAGLVSEQDLENARLDLERARSDEISSRLAVANLEEKLADTVLRSPIDGIVLEKLVEVGQVISSGVSSYTGGTSIAVIADLSRVYVTADVDETDIGRVALGQRVEAVPDAFPDRRFSGVVERISPQSQIVQNVTTFQVVTVLENKEGLLKAGMNVAVDILVAGKDEALTVPRRAVRAASEIPALAATLGIKPPDEGAPGPPGGSRGQEGASGGPASSPPWERGGDNGKVVCIKTAGGYQFKSVTVGLNDYDQYEISQGLNEGDEVVVFLTSRALDQSRQFIERRRGSGIPGLSRGGGPR
jgi:HlyD family secretion protein